MSCWEHTTVVFLDMFFLLISLFITIQHFSITQTVTAKPSDYHLFLILTIFESHSEAEEQLFIDFIGFGSQCATMRPELPQLLESHVYFDQVVRFPGVSWMWHPACWKAFLPPLPLHILQPSHNFCSAELMSRWAEQDRKELFLRSVGGSWSFQHTEAFDKIQKPLLGVDAVWLSLFTHESVIVHLDWCGCDRVWNIIILICGTFGDQAAFISTHSPDDGQKTETPFFPSVSFLKVSRL